MFVSECVCDGECVRGCDHTVHQADPVAVANLGLKGASKVSDGPLLNRRERPRVGLLLCDPGFEITIVDGFVKQRRSRSAVVVIVVVRHHEPACKCDRLGFLAGWSRWWARKK